MEKLNLLGGNKVLLDNAILKDVDGTLNVCVGGYGRPISDTFLEDVEIEITKNGILHLNGKRIVYESTYDYRHYSELKESGKYILEEKYIDSPKKILGIVCNPDPLYTERWLEMKERKPFTVTTTNYRITEV